MFHSSAEETGIAVKALVKATPMDHGLVNYRSIIISNYKAGTNLKVHSGSMTHAFLLFGATRSDL